MLLTIDDTQLIKQSGDYMYLERDNFVLIVTHGDEDGNLLTPKGQLIPTDQFVSHMVRLYGEKEVSIIACNEQARSNKGLPESVNVTPLGLFGEVNVKYHHYIDGQLGDLLVEGYTEQELRG